MNKLPYQVDIITLVPHVWQQWLGADSGLVGKAFSKNIATLNITDLRQFGHGPHHKVDDAPFGGGAGMVLTPEPLHKAITSVRKRQQPGGPVLLLSPRGQRFCQKIAYKLSQQPGITLICGRYEGVDERVWQYVDGGLSLGDFVLSAGDPAAFAVVDAVVRLLPHVLGNPESLQEESFGRTNGLEYPHYTRPAIYDGVSVPSVLQSGDHAAIARWRKLQALALTEQHRPDLLDHL